MKTNVNIVGRGRDVLISPIDLRRLRYKRKYNRLRTNPSALLTSILNASMLPQHGALVDTIDCLCESPTKDNISVAEAISSRAKMFI